MNDIVLKANQVFLKLRDKTSGKKINYFFYLSIASVILYVFWFTSRYPSLFKKATKVGVTLPSMTYDSKLDLALFQTNEFFFELTNSVASWLWSMKYGMMFGVLFGALLHTYVRFNPLKMGKNTFLNTLKGAIIGIPMGVCANCSVPLACSITRGQGKIEAALGYLFSSPNFNPVVISMTIGAFPLSVILYKYTFLLILILVIVPGLLYLINKKNALTSNFNLPALEKKQTPSLQELAREYVRSVWMLLKPTIILMLIASVLSSLMLMFIPIESLIAEKKFTSALLVSFVSTLMPIPIALDVLYAKQILLTHGSTGYAAMFLTTLGAYSLVPAVYLWREISKFLSVFLFMLFWIVGAIAIYLL